MKPMKRRMQWWPGALYAGSVGGALGLVLLLRLNPWIEFDGRAVVIGVPIWMSWGVVMIGVPLVLLGLIATRFVAAREERTGEMVAFFLVAAFLLGAVASWVNAEVHPEFLSETGRRQLHQDAVTWVCGAILTIASTVVWRRTGRNRTLAAALIPIAGLLPVLRLLGEPSAFRLPSTVAAQPLGETRRSMLVVGVEGLDSKMILTHAAGRNHPGIDALLEEGAWGPTDPFRPLLEEAYWATLATGTLPSRHGVMFRWGWTYPVAIEGVLRLLPWTPQGSRLFLAWDQGTKVAPPPSTVPPLWQRLESSGMSTEVLEWPGEWEPAAKGREIDARIDPWGSDPSLRSSLEALLVGSFPEEAPAILRTLRQDEAVVGEALQALDDGADNVWIVVRSLAAARRSLEPHRSGDSGRREALGLVFELLDEQILRLRGELSPDTVLALVSPFGLEPPDATERLRRLLGFGGDWRASAERCPDGVFIVAGEGVVAGGRLPPVGLHDVVPTLCYLLELPVAQYMEGTVILDAIDPQWLNDHPLRVVE